MEKLRNAEQSSEFRLQDDGVNKDIQNKIAEAGEYIRKQAQERKDAKQKESEITLGMAGVGGNKALRTI